MKNSRPRDTTSPEGVSGTTDTPAFEALLASNPPPDYQAKALERLCTAAGVNSLREIGALLRWDDLMERQVPAVEAVEFMARLIVRLRISPFFLFFGLQPMRIPSAVPLQEQEIEEALTGLLGPDSVRRWKDAGYGVGGLLHDAREG